MSRNSQGLYTLPLPPVRPAELIESAWANTTMDDIASALTGSLPRDGSAPMVGPLILSNDPITASRQATSKAYVDSFLAYATGMPVGAVLAIAGSTIPGGYLLCDGRAVSRTDYAVLFAAIGTIYGSGDGATTFNLPDMRDWFIRGKSDARQVGSTQAASFAAHTHPVSDPGHAHNQAAHSHGLTTGGHTHSVNDPGHSHSVQAGDLNIGSNWGLHPSQTLAGPVDTSLNGTGITISAAGGLSGSTDSQTPAIGSNQTGVAVGATGEAETRPQNIAMHYVIKAVDDASATVGITSITSSDENCISIDSSIPPSPELVVHTNVAFGLVKLDAGVKIPLDLLPTGTTQMLGFFDASGGQTPSEEYPLETFSSGDTFIISVGGDLMVFDPVTLTPSLTTVIAGNLLQYITGSFTNPTGWYYVTSSAVVAASQVLFAPTAPYTANDVQGAIDEVPGFTVAKVGGDTGAAQLPSGTEVQRPSGVFGMMRGNTETGKPEFFDGAAWGELGGGGSGFLSGTRLMFPQPAAPLGWTQITDDSADNRMLRVVNAAGGGVGGSASPIVNNVVPAHTHGFTTGNESATHTHSGTTGVESNTHTHNVTGNVINSGANTNNVFATGTGNLTITTSTTSGVSATHTHSFTTGNESVSHTHSGTTDNGSSNTNWTPRYIDMILCVKD